MNRDREGYLSRSRGTVAGIVWPPLHSGEIATLVALYAHLDESQWYSPDELVRLQNNQLVSLATHAVRQSTHFARRLDSAGLTPADLGTLAGFRKLPVIGKREVQEAGQSLFSREIPWSHRPTNTTKSSGSTGEPVVIQRTVVSQLDWLATTLRDHRWHGRDFSARLRAIRTMSADPALLADWGPPASLLFPCAPSLILPASMPIPKLAGEIARFDPAYLLVYPSILEGLINHWQCHGMGFSSLREVRLIGETFSSSARQAATEFLGVSLIDLYSSQEVGNIAFQCPESHLYHVMAETLRVEILDEHDIPAKPGHPGRVVVSDLRNFATPLLRYDLGDYAEMGPACPCGRGLPTLSRIAGRLRNLVVLPTGERHWPQIGFGDYRKIAPIRQYQLIQHDLDLIEVRLVCATTMSSSQEAALGAIIHSKLGHAFRLRFEYFADRLPTGPGGKFEEFLCRI